MNEVRLNVVVQAFEKLDLSGQHILPLQEIKKAFSAKNNPDVRKRLKSEDEIVGEFFSTFELHHSLRVGVRDQRVRIEEFVEYYNYVSSGVDSDEEFVHLIEVSFSLN